MYTSCSFLGSCCFLGTLIGLSCRKKPTFFPRNIVPFLFPFFSFYNFLVVHRFFRGLLINFTSSERNDVYVSNVKTRLVEQTRAEVRSPDPCPTICPFERINK